MPLTTSDRLDLLDLVHRYAACVDERDVDAAAALFTEDGVLAVPAPPRTLTPVHESTGAEQIGAALGSVRGLTRTVHTIGGVVLDAEEGGARGRVTATAHHLSEDAGALRDLMWHLHYRDSYRRTERGWRFVRRELVIDVIESRPVARARPHGIGAQRP
jgi:ketosteroid isomerase-like protein